MSGDEELKRFALGLKPEDMFWARACKEILEAMRFTLDTSSPEFVAGVQGAVFHVLRKSNGEMKREDVLHPQPEGQRLLERAFFKVLASNVRREEGLEALRTVPGEVIAKIDRAMREQVSLAQLAEGWRVRDAVGDLKNLDPDVLLNRLATTLMVLEAGSVLVPRPATKPPKSAPKKEQVVSRPTKPASRKARELKAVPKTAF